LYDLVISFAREDVAEMGDSSDAIVALDGSERVMAQVVAELRFIAVVIDRVIKASTPTLGLLEVSRAVQLALVNVNDWNS
jgi:hypothetical protein